VYGAEEEFEQKKLKDQGFPYTMYNKKKPHAELNPYSWNR
jgi:hypothetical protein